MKNLFALLVLASLGTGCSPQRYFFYPNSVLYNNPEALKISYALVFYPSVNGKKIYAMFFPTDREKPLGVIVHFHGNFGNVSNHFPLILFLTKAGFDVLSFDYEGYGASAGHPTMKNVIDDGEASVLYAYDHRRYADEKVGVFGQSLGGAVACTVAAKLGIVSGVVLEAPFSSYRAMAQNVLGRHFFLWPLYPMTWFLSRAYDPVNVVSQIAPRPLLILHGSADQTVPVKMSQALYDQALDPKELWIVPGADHLGIRRAVGKAYDDKIIHFFKVALQPTKTT